MSFSKAKEFFRGKVALITGSSSGIGQATAVAFAEHGSKVAITGQNAQRLQETKELCSKAGLRENEIFTLAGDITDENFRTQLVEQTISAFGRLDFLINNAARLYSVNLVENSCTEVIDLYTRHFDTNLKSVIDLTKKCVDHLIASKGNIVNISSIAGTKLVVSSLFYCMTKAAMDMFTKGLANELGPKGVRVNSVNPGFTVTRMLNDYITDFSAENQISEEQIKQELCNSSPLNAMGTCEDIANVVLFLASDAAKFVTGSIYIADGGCLVK